MIEGERLQKVLAQAGVGSRRAVEDLIAAGRVRVNGERALLGRRIDRAKDVVEVDGSRVPLESDLVHYLLNKPAGVITTAADPQGRPTVMGLVDFEARVWPVGRLDIETEGALVLTNDGLLTQRLTHPSYGIPKTYLAESTGRIGPAGVRRLARGVMLDDGPTKPAEVRIVARRAQSSLVEITISEGRNRQVRRMLEAVGHPAKRLARVAIGPLMLGRLKPGTLRRLSPEEVRAVYRSVGL
ncbi:pseudouridine synthase [soil metagenome]